MDDDIDRILYTQEQLAQRVSEMGAAITKDYAGKQPLMVTVLRGAFVFMADLVRSVDLPSEVDFMAVSSYGSAAKSSGIVRIVKDLDTPLQDRDVIIVEDVLDSGLTLRYLSRNLHARGVRSLEIATLLLKNPDPAVTPRYVGFECPNEFVVGYGLDFAERYRNLPYIGVLKPSVYEK
ncbi:MAG: hypoxanthine phosphoribosyltransferase [Coriobacteriia bacterium]|nr:hypoxanthine phosphoribosyltransferase [Coriobacteriia bacterium]MBS5478608.1 hypoxanthine phosphoribosyltransferase [Coriobacteriia bacterium]